MELESLVEVCSIEREDITLGTNMSKSTFFKGRAVRTNQLDLFERGDIIVGEGLNRRQAGYIKYASGVIVSQKKVMSDSYIVPRIYEVPSIMGVQEVDGIRTGDYVQVEDGSIYVRKSQR